MNPTFPPRDGARLIKAASLIAALVLCGCASTPPAPSASLEEARHAIATAEQAEAGRYASGDLNDARSNLASANTAVSAKRMLTAQHFAEESTVDAELATAKTADIKANLVNDDMRRSTATLIQEIQRTSGETQ